jgi:hypothetical protein
VAVVLAPLLVLPPEKTAALAALEATLASATAEAAALVGAEPG